MSYILKSIMSFFMDTRKIRKLIFRPYAFFYDAIQNRRRSWLTVKKVENVNNVEKVKIPSWYQAYAGAELTAALDSDEPVLLYVPWIHEHGNVLISKVRSDQHYKLVPLDFAVGIFDNLIRVDVSRFARENPDLYRRLIARRLVAIRKKVAGLVLTFDWAPVMRIIASVCEELEIPRVLIPHESVFINSSLYYWDQTALASVPIADIVLAWGQLHKDIFIERGYPEERIQVLGSPKLDTYFNYQPLLSRKQFCGLFGLEVDRNIVLFAVQPLDSQLDTSVAKMDQRRAVKDLLVLSQKLDFQLIVRLPPSGVNILGNPLSDSIRLSNSAVLDDSNCYFVAPEEAIYHCRLVISINSTMLFEALLAGRHALSIKYTNFEQIWERAGIVSVSNKDELEAKICSLLGMEWEPSPEAMTWAAHMFGVGHFDGQACFRIREELIKLVQRGLVLGQKPSALACVFARKPLDVICIPSTMETLTGVQQFVPKMLGARTVVSFFGERRKLKSLASVEIFFQWGIKPNKNKTLQHKMAKLLARPILFIEDGFIRSIDIGLSGEPTLSIIIDDKTAYYDATCTSRLQRLIESGPDLTYEQALRSRSAIKKVVKARVSKYNHAPDFSLKVGRPSRRKVLLVDQRFGDQSVISGLADESTFECMLQDVIIQYADHDIIIKQHPDAIKGGKSSYFSDDRLAFAKGMENLFLLNFDVNPYALLDIVDEVFVVTSGMGFEALMAGKTVHCYGVPFYSGWGLTSDKIPTPDRKRRRSLEDIFYYAYIESSRYFHPVRNCVVEVEELIDYIEFKRGF